METHTALTLMIGLLLVESSSGFQESYSPISKHAFQSLRHKSSSIRQGEEMRLPRNLMPSIYTIRLLPFIEQNNFTTQGNVVILVDCMEDTNNITLNSADIDIDVSSISVLDTGAGSPLAVKNFVDNQKTHETITIQTVTMLKAGQNYKISMNFVSYLNEELRGFYRSSYEENGITKYLAVSQMESTDARRAFPCFDEPNMKAKFSLILGRKESMTSCSNMPLLSTNPNDDMPGYVWDFYETSLTMSSYLVAMMVSDFISVPSDSSIGHVQFNIWSRAAAKNQTEYARDKGPRVLDFFESYFEIPFPLPKQDMVALPDFAAGAMENWGLITYRDEYLLFDEKKSSAANKQRVVEVIAHELAHQWFGDLVTIDWWDTIWLNEGFARYMQYVGADAVEPTFAMNDQFIFAVMHKVFDTDALESSRPMSIAVNTPAEIDQVFDTISYDKGASVVRMLANFLGLETFQRGLTLYLTKLAYGNAVQDDLWQALQEQAGIDNVVLPTTIKAIMDSWTLKKNYPLITVTRDYNNLDSALITQERFLMRKSEDTSDTTLYQWWVPLTCSSSTSTIWMSNDEKNKTVSPLGAKDNEWTIFNVDQQGYYRVKYDETNYNLIQTQLQSDHTKISSINRAQLLNDGLNIAKANLLSYDVALDMTLYLTKEREYVPWHSALIALTYLDSMLYTSTSYASWKKHMSSLIEPLYNDVNFEESSSDPLLLIYIRGDALDWACRLLGIADCVKKSQDAYAAWMKEPEAADLSPNQKKTLTCTAIANGGNAEWDFAYEIYLKSEVVNEKQALLSAMGCSKDPTILLKMLEMMIDPSSGIRLQNANQVFSYVAQNPEGNRIAFEFLRDRWDDMYNYFYGYTSMGSFFKTVSNNYNTDEQLNEMMQLKNDHLDVLEGSGSVDQAIEIIKGNIDWMAKNYDEVANWLQPIPSSGITFRYTTLALIASFLSLILLL